MHGSACIRMGGAKPRRKRVNEKKMISCYTTEYWLAVKQNEISSLETYPRWFRNVTSLDIEHKELGDLTLWTQITK